jgi:hypothetical protein
MRGRSLGIIQNGKSRHEFSKGIIEMYCQLVPFVFKISRDDGLKGGGTCHVVIVSASHARIPLLFGWENWGLHAYHDSNLKTSILQWTLTLVGWLKYKFSILSMDQNITMLSLLVDLHILTRI